MCPPPPPHAAAPSRAPRAAGAVSKTRKKRVSTKIEGAPKRPATGYFLFGEEKRAHAPDGTKIDMKHLAQLWSALSEADRKVRARGSGRGGAVAGAGAGGASRGAGGCRGSVLTPPPRPPAAPLWLQVYEDKSKAAKAVWQADMEKFCAERGIPGACPGALAARRRGAPASRTHHCTTPARTGAHTRPSSPAPLPRPLDFCSAWRKKGHQAQGGRRPRGGGGGVGGRGLARALDGAARELPLEGSARALLRETRAPGDAGRGNTSAMTTLVDARARRGPQMCEEQHGGAVHDFFGVLSG